jgi:hypothetical protein
MTDITMDTDDRPAKPYLSTVATVLLVVAVLGAWQFGERRDRDAVEMPQPGAQGHGATAAAGPPQTPSSPNQATVGAGRAAPTTAGESAGRARARGALTVYLVASTDQFGDTWSALTEAEVVRHQMGEPPHHHTVMLVRSEDDARALGAADEVRATLDLPPLEVVDLRAP